MKFLLIHGRDNPEKQMQNWGFNGPTLEKVKYVHSVYSNLTIGFETAKAASIAHELTGWPYFDDAVLEIEFFDDMVVCRSECGNKKYYGDWELQQEKEYYHIVELLKALEACVDELSLWADLHQVDEDTPRIIDDAKAMISKIKS